MTTKELILDTTYLPERAIKEGFTLKTTKSGFELSLHNHVQLHVYHCHTERVHEIDTFIKAYFLGKSQAPYARV